MTRESAGLHVKTRCIPAQQPHAVTPPDPIVTVEQLTCRDLPILIVPPETSPEVTRLREINREIVMLLAHELGTPLTHVLAYLRLLQERAPAAEQAEVDLALDQALTLKNRLDDILLLNQLEAGQWDLYCGPVSIQAALACVVQNQRWRLEEKGLKLHSKIACSRPVRADKEMLTRALAHVLINACKFSNSPGHIELIAQELDHACCIAIRDYGIGIPPDKQAHIFEPFYQADLSHARRYNGMGIGLKLARAIVEKHGGSIHVYSEVGHGSTFTVTIPLA